MKFFACVILCLVQLGVAQAAGYAKHVVALDVEVRYINGELRFCERKHLRGITCGYEQKLFGKRRFAARDWWAPETYVQTVTGLNEFTLLQVAPTPDGTGLVIYFED